MAKALTVLSLEKMKPDPGRRLEIPDALLPGLYHVIQPTGARSWAVRYRAAGKPRKLTLGAYPALELGAARDAARLALRDAAKGADPAASKQEARRAAKAGDRAGRDHFGNVAREFLARHAARKNRSWRETARLIGLVPDKTNPDAADNPRAFVAAEGGIAEKWASRPVAGIKRSEVVELLDGIFDRAPIVANRTFSALSKLFNWARDTAELITVSPCAGLEPPANEISRDRVLTDDEIRWLWKATAGKTFGPLVRLLLLTGQRRDEVAGMTRAEVSGAVWTIPKERAKNNQQHVVPLSEAAQAALASAPRIVGRKGFVFTTTGETHVSGWSRAKTAIDRGMLAAARQEALEAGADPATATIPRWTFHDLRRTAASGMARLGIAVHVVERLLNHRSGTIRGVAAIYNRHDYLAEREAAAEAWGRYVTDLVEGKRAGNVLHLRAAK